jgi:capsular polysaccharide biosynthesis protein/MinD-like ATPase involved in chromosome partitioning or flagellar assembly
MDATPSTPASSDLTQYGALLRRRWWVVVACSVLGLAVGGALLVIEPKIYTSSAQILIKEPTTDVAQQTAKKSAVNLDTEAAVLKSEQVAIRAKSLLKTDEDAARLSRRIEVSAIPSSSVLGISYSAGSPAAAQRGAHLYAQAYLDNRVEQIKAANAKQIAVVREQFVNLDRQQKALVQQLVAMPPSQEKLKRQAELARIQEQMQRFSERIVELDGNAADPGMIISDARPGRQTAPIMPLYLGSGLMIGLLFGVIIALWRDRADRRIRRAEDIERLLNLPVLLNVPVKGRHAMGLLPARSQGGQAFHELAHSLNATLGHGNHVVLVAGVTPGLGAGAICANLAAALARTDADVVLVCANLPSSYSARLLNLSEGPGLSEVLVHGTPVSEVVQTPRELPGMRVITPGHDEDLAWERLQTQSMDRLVSGLRRHATHVILEAPPTSTSADAQALAEIADASIIVVEIPRAEREHVGESMRQLDRMGTAVLGAVVLPVQPGTAPPHPVAASDPQPAARPPERQRGPERRSQRRAERTPAPEPGHRRRSAPPLEISGSAGEHYPDGMGTAGYADQAPPPLPTPPPLALPTVPKPPPAAAPPPSSPPAAAPPLPSSPQSQGAQSQGAQGSARSAPRHRKEDRTGLAAYADTPADSYPDERQAEMFPPETFKTQNFEAAEPGPMYEAIDDLLGEAPAEEDAYADPGRVGDR